MNVPVRYDIKTDELVPVTQEWVDFVQREFSKFGLMREATKEAIKAQQAFLDLWSPERRG